MKEVTFTDKITVELIEASGDEQSIVRAARVSTKGSKAEAEEAKGLVKFLVREGHHVPLEHTLLTFRIHAPIFVTRQILKHRAGVSISEESGRYRELEPVFYKPGRDRKIKQVGKTGDYNFVDADEEAHATVDSAVIYAGNAAWSCYETMLEAGVAKEVARMVLPVNLYSTMFATFNLRSALHFVNLRTSRTGSHPQHEIEQVAEPIYEVLKERFPNVVAAWEERE